MMGLLGCPEAHLPKAEPPTVPVQIDPTPTTTANPEPLPVAERPTKRGRLFVELEQRGRTTTVRDRGHYELSRAPFSLVFPLDAYRNKSRHVAQVAIDTSAKVIDASVIGKNKDDDSHPFSMGKGLAAHRDGYHSIVLGSDAHHYLLFDPEDKSSQRVEILSTLPDGRYEASFHVAKVLRGQDDVPIEQLSIAKLFFAVLLDDNLNGRLDEGELFRFEVALK